MTDNELRAIRNFVTWTFLKVVVASGVVFTLIRVVVPELFNAHDDALGALGLLSAVAAPVIAGWAAVSIFTGMRRFIGEANRTKEIK